MHAAACIRAGSRNATHVLVEGRGVRIVETAGDDDDVPPSKRRSGKRARGLLERLSERRPKEGLGILTRVRVYLARRLELPQHELGLLVEEERPDRQPI